MPGIHHWPWGSMAGLYIGFKLLLKNWDGLSCIQFNHHIFILQVHINRDTNNYKLIRAHIYMYIYTCALPDGSSYLLLALFQIGLDNLSHPCHVFGVPNGNIHMSWVTPHSHRVTTCHNSLMCFIFISLFGIIWICIPASQAWYCKQIAIHIHPYTTDFYIYINTVRAIHQSNWLILSEFVRGEDGHVPLATSSCSKQLVQVGFGCGGCYSFVSSLVDGKSLKSWNRLNRTLIYTYIYIV